MADPRRILLPPPTQRTYTLSPNHVQGEVRDVSAYASDLARWENSHKHKFLFITEIELNPNYKVIADMTRFALLTQTASRPKLKFEHTEYNEYGVRKGVLTKTTFEPVNLSFIDDNDNSVMQFFTNVTKMMSPITNIENSDLVDTRQYDFRTGDGVITNINTTAAGINVQELDVGDHRPNVYAQSSGFPGRNLKKTRADGESITSIFKSVKIHHIHLYGEGVNTFAFKNPRLLSMDFDDLDMASTDDISTLKLSFGYDYLTSYTGKMTADISKLIGTNSNYFIRRDLSSPPAPASVPVNNPPPPSPAFTAEQAQIRAIDAQIEAAQAARAAAADVADKAAYEKLIANLSRQ